MRYYLDANATTFMPDLVIKHMIKWTNKGNASATYETAQECKQLLTVFKQDITNKYDIPDHTIIFTSGASESNSHIIISSVRAYMNKTGKMPHVIISAIEHKSITACCEQLADDGLCQFTKVGVITEDSPYYGMVNPIELEKSIRPNTCLISIMTANNETGIINDIPALVGIANRARIPFHTDCVQSFGKYGIYNKVDACSISFHKLYGPPGIGLLIIRNAFIEGYGLKPLIAGSQNGGLRGGTENIPSIGGAYAAYRYSLLGRSEKNAYLNSMKELFMDLMKEKVPCFNISEFEKQKHSKNKIFWITNKDSNKVLCNTILLAIYKDNFCNIKLREELKKYGIILSVGSACNTSSIRASDVLYALKLDPSILSGVVRISFQDTITGPDIKYCVEHFVTVMYTIKLRN
jgi:cysteine desulfurase